MASSTEDDAGTPLPNFNSSHIQLQTIAPALGVQVPTNKPDYLEYDTKGRGIMTTMFANTGLSYLIGILGGGVYGLQSGLSSTPSKVFRVQLNSVLNHCGRYGSRAGNSVGVFSVLYSLYEGLADHLELDERTGLRNYSPGLASFTAPGLGGFCAASTFYVTAGPRAALLAGSLGLGTVGATYAAYTVLGIPYGSRGFLFF